MIVACFASGTPHSNNDQPLQRVDKTERLVDLYVKLNQTFVLTFES